MEMASKISKEMTVMKRGLGEKVANILSSSLGMILSMALGFYVGWLLGLIIFAAFPVLIGIALIMYTVFNTGAVETMKAYA